MQRSWSHFTDSGLEFLPHEEPSLKEGLQLSRVSPPGLQCLEMAISHVPRYLKRVNNQQAIKCLRVTLGKSLPISGPQFVYLELEESV